VHRRLPLGKNTSSVMGRFTSSFTSGVQPFIKTDFFFNQRFISEFDGLVHGRSVLIGKGKN